MLPEKVIERFRKFIADKNLEPGNNNLPFPHFYHGQIIERFCIKSEKSNYLQISISRSDFRTRYEIDLFIKEGGYWRTVFFEQGYENDGFEIFENEEFPIFMEELKRPLTEEEKKELSGEYFLQNIITTLKYMEDDGRHNFFENLKEYFCLYCGGDIPQMQCHCENEE